ncbi:MAG: hypothetical protein JXO44_13445 [Clostridia bacterium]|nr:hypothetical protein [Clostridia bacterium]
MNSYLLLENGVTYDCTAAESKNILGLLTQTSEGVSIRCCATGEEILISSESGDYQINASSMHKLVNHTKSKLKAKIVTDTLPLEYHLYDLKSDFN